MQYQTAPCKVGEVRSHQALQTFTQFSVTSLFLSDLLAVFETCRETVEMFSEFIINSHLRPKQCLFQQSSQSVMQRGSLGQQPFNFTMPSLLSHKWKLNLTHTSLCPHVFEQRTAPWETGSPRPSDNLLLHRTMTECFPIMVACCCFRVSSCPPQTVQVHFYV